MPRSRNTKVRAKDTSRAEARRRYRDEHREVEPNTLSVNAEPIQMEEPPKRSAFALPDIRADVAALPQVFRKPLVWAPFGLLLIAFVLALALDADALPEGTAADVTAFFVQITLPPTALFVFFIGGFVADRASYLVGGLLGVLDATLLTILQLVAPNTALEGAGVTEAAQGFLMLWAIAIFVGVLAAGFAAWYKRFLRSSQSRARANKAAKEKEQMVKAKEQARADKQAARDARNRS